MLILIKRLFLITLIVLLLVLKQNAFAVIGIPRPTQPYAPDQLIVKYKEIESPQYLQVLILEKQEKKKTVLGFFQILIEDIKMHIRGQETPENKLQKIQEIDSKAGVVLKRQLGKGGSFLKNTYVLHLKKGSNVLKTVKLYKSLPFVEYAQPNYTVTIQ